ncbi:hypothetical protein EG359_14115 [Chryseobacterium joostei]|uniref:Iron complex outermembrane recepter protein n=1 Tax=Chryseobacterium joostei TaxID=112234 RepID=A0A1N7I6J3_9FLAO|nr:hypothetical protein [Chryseobacterium joostei]AZB00676.1 hypothetical protein EG359_14115 [Chryseobacterium joostei]SIS32687.1 iron complex outermembrane recepter protein [Chryseobacterium joostei]
MKNVLIYASMLGPILPLAQEKDSTHTRSIEEVVVINSYIKKDREYSNKMHLKAIENPQPFSSIDNQYLGDLYL